MLFFYIISPLINVQKSNERKIPINVKVLEAKFALKSNTLCVPGSSSAQSRTKGKGATLHLLDPKKAQNLGILLTAIRAPFHEIRKCLISMDSSVLSVGNAISLIKLLPTEEEVLYFLFYSSVSHVLIV